MRLERADEPMETSRRATEEDHLVHCRDFMGFYLVQACGPVQRIQQYAHRVSGRGSKKEELKDLSEEIVKILIDCLLDGLGVGQPELHMAVEELEDQPTEFYLGLGNTVEERKLALELRKDCRIQWMPNCAIAINRALADVRQYVMKGTKLLPKPKCKVVETNRSISNKDSQKSATSRFPSVRLLCVSCVAHYYFSFFIRYNFLIIDLTHF